MNKESSKYIKSGDMKYDDFCRHLAGAFERLSNQLQVIGRFIIDHPSDVALETAAEIAAKLKIQPSGLIRFAQALGFAGFSNIQAIFRERLRSQLPDQPKEYGERIAKLQKLSKSDRLADAILNQFGQANSAALEQLLVDIDTNDVETAAEYIRNAEKIFVAGQRRSFTAAVFTYYNMDQIGLPVFLIDSVGGMQEQQLRVIGADDVLLCITYPNYAPETLRAIARAQEVGARIITITDNPISPAVEASHIAFCCDRSTVSGFRTVAATLCLAQVLAICAVTNATPDK